MIDSDIEFPDNIISRFISKDLPKDLVALSCNGKDHKLCKIHKNCHHYYDTLALIYKNNNSGFKYFSKYKFQCCQFEQEDERLNWFNGKLVETRSSFGGMCFYKTDTINKSDVKYSLGKHNHINFYCEHIGFNECLNKYGKIYADPTFVVNNVENKKYMKKIKLKKWPIHPDNNLPINLSNVVVNADIWVCSFGGCASNYLVKNLEKYGYNIQTTLYHKILCHSPIQIKTDKPIIYLYRNIQDAWNSVKSRDIGFYDVNIKKLSNNKNVIISEENLLKLMIEQFKNWTKNIGNNILYMSYQDLFTEKSNILLKKFLNNKNIKKFKFNADSKKKYIFPKYLSQKYNLFFDYFDNFHNKIKYFRIFGERNSGTNFMEKLINKNFYLNNITHQKHCLPNLNCSKDILNICIIRNCSNWINSMYNNPYHLIISKKKNIYDFINNKTQTNTKCPSSYNINLDDKYSLLELRYMKYAAYKNLSQNTVIVKLDYLQESEDNIILFLKYVSEKYNIHRKKKINLVKEYKGGQGDRFTKNKKISNYKNIISPLNLNFYDKNLENEIDNIKISSI